MGLPGPLGADRGPALVAGAGAEAAGAELAASALTSTSAFWSACTAPRAQGVCVTVTTPTAQIRKKTIERFLLVTVLFQTRVSHDGAPPFGATRRRVREVTFQRLLFELLGTRERPVTMLGHRERH
jgi:hypothetical protein